MMNFCFISSLSIFLFLAVTNGDLTYAEIKGKHSDIKDGLENDQTNGIVKVSSHSKTPWKSFGRAGPKRQRQVGVYSEEKSPFPSFLNVVNDFLQPTVFGETNHKGKHASLVDEVGHNVPDWLTTKIDRLKHKTFSFEHENGKDDRHDNKDDRHDNNDDRHDNNDDRHDNNDDREKDNSREDGNDITVVDFEISFPPLRSTHRDSGKPSETKTDVLHDRIQRLFFPHSKICHFNHRSPHRLGKIEKLPPLNEDYFNVRNGEKKHDHWFHHLLSHQHQQQQQQQEEQKHLHRQQGVHTNNLKQTEERPNTEQQQLTQQPRQKPTQQQKHMEQHEQQNVDQNKQQQQHLEQHKQQQQKRMKQQHVDKKKQQHVKQHKQQQQQPNNHLQNESQKKPLTLKTIMEAPTQRPEIERPETTRTISMFDPKQNDIESSHKNHPEGNTENIHTGRKTKPVPGKSLLTVDTISERDVKDSNSKTQREQENVSVTAMDEISKILDEQPDMNETSDDIETKNIDTHVLGTDNRLNRYDLDIGSGNLRPKTHRYEKDNLRNLFTKQRPNIPRDDDNNDDDKDKTRKRFGNIAFVPKFEKSIPRKNTTKRKNGSPPLVKLADEVKAKSYHGDPRDRYESIRNNVIKIEESAKENVMDTDNGLMKTLRRNRRDAGNAKENNLKNDVVRDFDVTKRKHQKGIQHSEKKEHSDFSLKQEKAKSTEHDSDSDNIVDAKKTNREQKPEEKFVKAELEHKYDLTKNKMRNKEEKSNKNNDNNDKAKNAKDKKDDDKDNHRKWFGVFAFDEPPASNETAGHHQKEIKKFHLHQGAVGLVILGLMIFIVLTVACTVSCASSSNQEIRRVNSRTAIYMPNDYYDEHSNRRKNFSFLDS